MRTGKRVRTRVTTPEMMCMRVPVTYLGWCPAVFTLSTTRPLVCQEPETRHPLSQLQLKMDVQVPPSPLSLYLSYLFCQIWTSDLIFCSSRLFLVSSDLTNKSPTSLVISVRFELLIWYFAFLDCFWLVQMWQKKSFSDLIINLQCSFLEKLWIKISPIS